MVRKRVALCIRVSTATGEGREWLYASECPQPQGKEESGFMHQYVHIHRERKRLASLHQSVHRHIVRKRVALWRERKIVAL